MSLRLPVCKLCWCSCPTPSLLTICPWGIVFGLLPVAVGYFTGQSSSFASDKQVPIRYVLCCVPWAGPLHGLAWLPLAHLVLPYDMCGGLLTDDFYVTHSPAAHISPRCDDVWGRTVMARRETHRLHTVCPTHSNGLPIHVAHHTTDFCSTCERAGTSTMYRLLCGMSARESS